jgi:hypothetical protein
MKRHLIVIGVVSILLAVGLSGCTNTKIDNFKDIHEHLPKYIGTEVTLEGYVASILGKSSAQDGLQDSYIADFLPSSDVENDYRYSILLSIPPDININKGMYRISGIVDTYMNSTPMINVTNALTI